MMTQDHLVLPKSPAPQEPVAWMYEWSGRTHITTVDQRPIEHAHPHFNQSKPLYTAPQPPAVDQQFDTWSHDDGDSWYDNPGDAEIIQSCLGRDAKVGDEYELWASIDAVTLRYRIVAQHGDDFEVECISQPQQKTAPRSPAAQQKPVALVKVLEAGGNAGIATRIVEIDDPMRERLQPGTKLYAAPNPARQPLTDEQILSIVRVAPALGTAEAEWLHVARAIEAAHGITESQP